MSARMSGSGCQRAALPVPVDIASRWFLHMHAVERMRTMGVTRAAVLSVLNDPEVTWTASLHDGRRGLDRRMYVRGGLAVVTSGRKVLTVLLHTREGTPWTR